MKSFILTLITLCCLSLSMNISASCGSGGCNTGASCVSDDCENSPNYIGDDESMCSECNCTDKGYEWNTCISKAKYCYAFGNVGGR